MPSQLSELEFAKQTARDAGALIKRLRQETLRTDFKQGIELVTNADTEADAFIRHAIEEHYPEHQILAEESNPDLDSIQFTNNSVWVVDPIDGTVNYAHSHNQVAISIALIVDGVIKIGVVYNPFSQEMFYAQASAGAFLNDEPISVSEKQVMQRAIIATGFPYDKQAQLPTLIHRLHQVLEKVADMRRLGSAALDICWVACGRLDAYYESVSLWDCAAGLLIAQEAGATCGHFKPSQSDRYAHLESKNLLIATPALFKPLHTVLKNT